MTQYHCWVVIRYHPHDTNLALQTACESACAAYLESYPNLSKRKFHVMKYNGQTTFMASALHNHGGEYIIDVFRWLGENAIGSYGLLHFSNDEAEGNENEFRLFVMRKGQVQEQADTLLSPRVPVIEDEYDETREDG